MIWSCKAPFLLSEKRKGGIGVWNIKKSFSFMCMILAVFVFISSVKYGVQDIDRMNDVGEDRDVNNQYYNSIKESAVMEIHPDVQDIGTDIASSAKTSQCMYDFHNLQERNPDIRGWLKIPDSDIDYPVCQAKDNVYYLSHDFDHDPSPYGCLFLDHRTKMNDTNRVIHGHNMGSGRNSMFSTLLYYGDPGWYNDHRMISYVELDGDSPEYKVFAVFDFDTKLLNDFDYMQRNFDRKDDFDHWIQYIKERNIYKNDVEVSENNKILILSTCNRVYGADHRFLVFAVKR